MKKLILSLFAITFLFGCERKSDIEIIPNFEVEYFKVSNYERYTYGIVPDETQKQMQADVYDIFKGYKSSDDIENPYTYELYMNEKGKIIKLKSEKKWNKKVDDKLVKAMSKWEFGKYIKDGESKKFRLRFSFGVYYYNHKGEDRVNVVIYGNNAVEINKELFFVVAEKMPEPIGGLKAIQNEVVYPKEAKENGKEGRVYVKAYIDTSGTVVKTEILRGIGFGCDEAAAKAVEKIKFTPAIFDNKEIGVMVTVPILFKLQ